jgi:hypothetical protein
MRTWPVPWILPSMVRSEAISDSLTWRAAARAGAGAAAGCTGGIAAAGVGFDTGVSGAMLRTGSAGGGTGALPVVLAGAWSFQRAMSKSPAY